MDGSLYVVDYLKVYNVQCYIMAYTHDVLCMFLSFRNVKELGNILNPTIFLTEDVPRRDFCLR